MVAPVAPELVIERVFAAPRARVWAAWTDPARMIKWMGPRDHPAVIWKVSSGWAARGAAA